MGDPALDHRKKATNYETTENTATLRILCVLVNDESTS